MSKLPSLTPLAACLATALALASPFGVAANRTVTNCMDSGTGSLRSAIVGASSGDTVVFDTVTMNCSTITLTSGQISIPVVQVTLQGPTASTLTIGGFHASRVFEHVGAVDPARKLTINNLTIANGAVAIAASPGARGGCIASTGDVTLFASTVTGCVSNNSLGPAYGGGVSANTLHMQNSTISNNQVNAGAGYSAVGGGVFVQDTADVSFSTISGNSALATTGSGFGGGLFSFYSGNVQIISSTISGNHATVGGGMALQYGPSSRTLTIDHSTISGNLADQAFGGLEIYDSSSTPNITANIVDSTISGNHSSGVVGGMFNSATLTLSNSTIAFNTADSGVYNVNYSAAAGLFTQAATLRNSIIANNTITGGAQSDLSAPTGSSPMLGSNNLIVATLGGTTAPPGTLTTDPMLGSLVNNGGPTLTHALLVNSPAIDAGCTINLPPTDQRGDGYPRVWGPAVDIGAFEYGDPIAGDVIFVSGFDAPSCGP
ncbi:MAG: right-handed parallel beta-helix repeat-containing protein [Dokdonella sp.]